MQISSVSVNPYLLAVQRASSPTGSGFADLIESAGKGEAATSPNPVSAPASKAATAPNFRNMTETEFTNQARAMFDRGEIDTDTFFTMQIQAHLKVAGSDVADGAPIDFVAKFKSLMDFETESGHRYSPLSGYSTYENILSKISTRTGANLIG